MPDSARTFTEAENRPEAAQAEPAASARAPGEVVLEYVREPEPVVECYVSRLPDRTEDDGDDEDGEAFREDDRTALRRATVRGVLLGVGVIALIALGVVIGHVSSGGRRAGDDSLEFTWREEREKTYTAADTTIARYPNGDGTRLQISETHGEELSVQEIYRRLNPSTVTVLSSLPGGTALVGSGVIFTDDGYILTNAHVIAGGKECMVVLSTGRRYQAALLGMDDEQDLAVIKVSAEGLPAAEFGDSDALSVGDPVCAIGNPLGVELRGTLTDGIVSAINRDVDVDGVMMTLIQTNAALNNGNSGGPLINRYGQVVGINTMKMGSTSRASVEGLGFAIPISATAYMVNDLIAVGEVRGEAMIGVSVQTAGVEILDGRVGVLILELLGEDGPGERAGLLPGDVILTADGEPIASSSDLLRIRRRHTVGDALELTVWRETAGEFAVEVVLAAMEG